MRGGYQPDSRLAGNGDEIVMSLMVAVRAPNREERRRAIAEAMTLARHRIALIRHLNDGGSPLELASA